MVSKKKTAKKDVGTAEKVERKNIVFEEPFEIPQEDLETLEESGLIEAADTDLTEKESAETLTEPEVAFVDETSKLLKLLGEAPPVPFIRTVEEAVAFVDKYAVWMRNVKAATG